MTTADGVEVDATSKVTVNGNVEALTTEHDTVARGVSAEGGAIVLVTGDVIVPGDFGIGLDIDAYDKESRGASRLPVRSRPVTASYLKAERIMISVTAPRFQSL